MEIGVDASRAVGRRRTGTEAYSYHLIRELLAIGGHRYTLYFNSPPSATDFPGGPNSRLRTMPIPRLWTHLRLSVEMLAHPPDVLFVPAHVLPAVHPRRSVVTVHDLGYLYQPRAYPRLRWWHLHLSTIWSARAARLLLADSKATRDDLVAHYAIHPAKIRVVYLGCSPDLRPASPEEIVRVQRQYGLPSRYLLSVGTIQPRKNLVRLVQAFAAARGDLGDAALVLAGGHGWGSADVHRAAESLGGAVRFPGYVAAEDVPGLYGGATALVFPSLHEGFGLPALEAMACGTPVIASATTSLPEVIGDAGVLVDPTSIEKIAAAMVALVHDPARQAELRAKGLERAKLFTWRRCAEETLRVLEEAGQSTL